VCQAACPVHDTSDKEWQHLDFFQHKAYLHARVPRIRCPEHGVLQVLVPWARPDSGFTLLFEAMVMAMVEHMAVLQIAERLGVTDQRLWRVVQFYTQQFRLDEDLSQVSQIGIDETACAAGQQYVTVVADLDKHRVIFATPGRDADTVGALAKDLQRHRGDPAKIQEVACDMSKAYIAGIGKHLPNAKITFDHFHLAKIVNDGVDQVRRQEQREDPVAALLLKGNRYAVLKNASNQSAHEAAIARLVVMPQLHLK
jgi:transposase